MERNFTSLIRFLMDECLPSAIRDSRWFMYPFYWIAYRGRNVQQAMDFKRDIVGMTQADYARYYASISSISRDRETDLNRQCIAAIDAVLGGMTGAKVLDAGCGNGFLARRIQQRHPTLEIISLDIIQPAADFPGVFCCGALDALPFQAATFDLVICSHALEHCLDAGKVVEELKRVCAKELIIVVPRQRPFYYTLDEHVQFFYDEEQLTSTVGIRQFECKRLGGDWFYRGFNVASSGLNAQSPSLSLNPSK